MIRRRVLLAITKSELGGAPRYVYHLATLLPRHGFDTVVACGGTDWLVQELHNARIPTIEVPELAPDRVFRTWTEVRALVRLHGIIQKHAFDIVHANSTRAGFLARLAAHAADVPVVIFTAHGFFFEEPMRPLRKALYRFAERTAARFTDAIITVSEADRRAALRGRICPPDKLVTIYNGLDKEQLDRDFWQAGTGREALRRGFGPGPVIGTVAMLYPTKGIRFLITAARRVLARYPEARFVIVGEGPHRSELEELVSRANLSARVSFVGRHDDVRRILGAFDLFVLPSVKEGLPYAVLEAMAAARPIVATRVGGIPEIIMHGRSGLLVPPGEAEPLAEAIISLLADPQDARQMGEEARKSIMREDFSADSMVAKTAQLYTRLLAEKLGEAEATVEA